MTKKHTVAIDAEHCKIGCYECDEWEDFRPFPGYVTQAELFCKYWLDVHLRKVEKMTNERIRVEILIQENIVPQLNALAKHLQEWGNESDLASMKLDKIINDLNNILNENAK